MLKNLMIVFILVTSSEGASLSSLRPEFGNWKTGVEVHGFAETLMQRLAGNVARIQNFEPSKSAYD
jgi:hypothetical protein